MNMSEGIKWLSKNNIEVRTVLDVGASDGCWSKDCMGYFPKSNYVLFEPQPVHINSLKLFYKSNKQKINVVYKAVGSSVGTTFFDANDPFGGALSESDGIGMIKVVLTTIDDTVQELKSKGPYLIKLDTHGYEKSILEGSLKTLEETNVLIIEAYNHRISNESFLFWELCSYLENKGFRPGNIVDTLNREYDQSLWQMDIFFIKTNCEIFKYNSYK